MTHTVESLTSTLNEWTQRNIVKGIKPDTISFLNALMVGCEEESAWKILAAFQAGQKEGLLWATKAFSGGVK